MATPQFVGAFPRRMAPDVANPDDVTMTLQHVPGGGSVSTTDAQKARADAELTTIVNPRDARPELLSGLFSGPIGRILLLAGLLWLLVFVIGALRSA